MSRNTTTWPLPPIGVGKKNAIFGPLDVVQFPIAQSARYSIEGGSACVIFWLGVTAIFAGAALVSQGQVPVPAGYKVKKGKDDKGRDVQYARAGHVTNYDESKGEAVYAAGSLPDAIERCSGPRRRHLVQEAACRKSWRCFAPSTSAMSRRTRPRVTWEVASSDANAKGGSALMKKIVGHIGDKADGPHA